MKILLTGLLSLSLLAPVLAAPTPTPSAPKPLLAMRPPLAQTRFFGEVKFPNRVHNRYFLHFYEFRQTPPVVYAPGERHRATNKDYIADLFLRTVRKGRANYHLMQRFRLDRSYFGDEVYAFDQVEASFLWLVPAKRRTPILRLTCTVTEGFYGAFGVDILLVFDKGLKVKPLVQGFHNYSNFDEGESFEFDQVDERGFRSVTSVYGANGMDGQRRTDMYWNGKGFLGVAPMVR